MIHYAIEKKNREIWLVENSYNPDFALKTESVFAQCNGYFGVRGAHDFKTISGKRGMFVCGLFSKAYETEVTELVNAPDLTEVNLILNGEEFCLDRSKIVSYERKFSVRTGELQIYYLCELNNGIQLEIRSRKFASVDNEHLFCQQLELKAVNVNVENAAIVSGINGQKTNSGVSHFNRVDCRVYEKCFLEVTGFLKEDSLRILSTASLDVPEKADREFALKRRSIYGKYSFTLKQGEVVCFNKYSYMEKSDDSILQEDARAILNVCILNGYEYHLRIHTQRMEERWNYASIEINGSTLEEEAAIYFAQYHLMGMVTWNTSNCSAAAKGLTGEGYNGHVFWDTEIFVLPFFTYVFPDVASQLLKFRYGGLDEAKAKAREYGYAGAMFPWEVAKSGCEETPLYAALNIHTGKANNVWSGIKEHHVTADIIYAIWQYFTLTGDEDFMKSYGYEIIFEAARFWVSRAEYEKDTDCYYIKDIIGPDEYTEHIDNNAYTNYMAYFCVNLAAKLTKSVEEQCKWNHFLEHLYLPKPGRDEIIPQDDTFLTKKRIQNIEKYKNSPIKQSVLLDYSRDEIVDMQVLKQADVVMLLSLFPHLFPEDVVKNNVLFYEGRTIHDSSLSYCVHAQACAMIGETKLAWNFFEKCMEIDLDDNPFDSTDGIHSASLGGIWNCVIFGFAGFTLVDGKILIQPALPEHWSEMSFYVKIKGNFVKVKVSGQQIFLECEQVLETPILVVAEQQEYLLSHKLEITRSE